MAVNKKKYWENHLFLDIINIKKYLKTIKNDKEKLQFLKFQCDELSEIYYHFTDDDIDTVFKEQQFDCKYERRSYSSFIFDEVSHVSNSEYRKLLRFLRNHIIPFLNNEIRILKQKSDQQGSVKKIEIDKKLNNMIVESAKEKIDPIQGHEIENETKIKSEMKKELMKIKWEGTETQIVYLIDELIKNRLLPKETNKEKYKIISEHFVNKENRDFNPKQLSVTFQNLTNKKPTRSEKIDEIITNTNKK